MPNLHFSVNIRPVRSVIVRPKNAFNTSPVKNGPEKKKGKRSYPQDSPVNISKKEILPDSNLPNIQKKKKKKPEDNKFESSHDSESMNKLNIVQNRKRKHFLEESEEDEKMKPKVEIKRIKNWNINDYALDEKPPVVPPENVLSDKCKVYKRIYNESDSSDVELADEEKKPKKKLKKEKLNQLQQSKGKSETSFVKNEKENKVLNNSTAELSVKIEKRYNSLDVSKEKKIFDNKEEKLQLEIAEKPDKKKKKSRRDSVKLNDLLPENKLDEKEEAENSQINKLPKNEKKETLEEQNFSSDFEVKDKRKSEKKSKKKLKKTSFFNEESFKWDDVNNPEEINKPKKEKTKKKVNELIDFDH